MLPLMGLYFEDTGGDKPPLLLIAGLASDEISWLYQKPALSQSFRLITCDNRGVGRSPKPSGPYQIAEMAADLLEVLDGLGIERAHILGHSMGGAIAQYLAIEFPERVDRTILACTFARPAGFAVPVVEGWAGVLKLGASPEVIGYTFFPWLYTESFLSEPGVLPACIDALARHPYPMEGEPVAAQIDALREFDSTSHLHRIGAPTLVLVAEEDRLIPPSLSRVLADGIPGARYEVLPATAHSCMLQTPDLFNQAVLTFLSGSL